jgi:hypothetical protein
MIFNVSTIPVNPDTSCENLTLRSHPKYFLRRHGWIHREYIYIYMNTYYIYIYTYAYNYLYSILVFIYMSEVFILNSAMTLNPDAMRVQRFSVVKSLRFRGRMIGARLCIKKHGWSAKDGGVGDDRAMFIWELPPENMAVYMGVFTLWLCQNSY